MTTMTAPPKTSQPVESRAASAQRRRVCHLSMTLETGGLERLLVDYGRFHNADKYELSFIALEGIGTPADELREAGFVIDQVRLKDLGKVAGFKRLVRLLHEHQVEILHTHNTYAQFYGALAAWWAGVPVVVNSQHGRGCGPNRKALWQFRIANELTHRIVGVSEDATELCRQQCRGRAARMQCIWNGIDLERFQFHGAQDSCSAISVGRLSPEKDYATLIRATSRVVESFPEFQLTLVGDGQERAALETLRNELGLERHITFLGERSDVHELLGHAGFFVSSSTTEGISLTLLEAMAVGLPIVTTAVGGSPEIVQPGETGKLVSPGDPESLASAMIEMLEERPLWPEMSRSARQRVEANFNIKKMILQYEELYDQLFEQRTSPLSSRSRT